ncbi:helix-turn-helix domain-containing protein [Arthrobacter bambusae]|uniref:Transcriptional regulator with XRE-family HTH domain n=1 Tax=Arthrobacter bambusae TaxID=1338426 RepID=A0AAW8DHX8_9MICC|nr:helix-turn-helix transcriptional regulator [Arthrobacter bambusae]MDP9904784.1 transcriptional regulator with XRE-family HTH domain [Arthrobacter bambusae]MDQ0129600.1 transcriptional regulator with XRE-family HTH domain [Arthrobacter bambusae]MDQ0180787.1 transcriptional regulator with XRE-family HTH domain [Arthrobacter bambusae]
MNTLPSDIFARRVRAERERQGVSQVELARRMASILGANVDPTAITRIEQQTRAVRLDEAVAMATILKVPLSSLIVDNDAEESEAILQRYLADLAAAHRQWEQTRQEIGRLTQIVQSLSGGYDLLHPDATAEHAEQQADKA